MKLHSNRQHRLTLTPFEAALNPTIQAKTNPFEAALARSTQNPFQTALNSTIQTKPSAEKSQSQATTTQENTPIQKKENNTGLPDDLKSGIENLSGHSMDDVTVHYNSDKPRQLQAHAYAQGADIHVAPGQEKHLPHEAWHVVQQKQGRVKPTLQMKGGININDDDGLEKEADIMGEKAYRFVGQAPPSLQQSNGGSTLNNTAQLRWYTLGEMDDEPNLVSLEVIKTKIDYPLSNIESLMLEEYAQDDKEHIFAINEQGKIERQEFQSVFLPYSISINEFNDGELEGYRQESAEGWEDMYDYEPGTGDSLHDLAYNVIVEAGGGQSSITGMKFDKIYKYHPATQIAFCLWSCRDDAEDVFALCLYTSYFYIPLNNYFRGIGDEPDRNTSFGKLLLKAAEILQTSYGEQDDEQIGGEGSRYRVELTSGWIDGNIENDDNGDYINFKALTSTHPDLGGVKGMWGDVAQGTFGEYDNIALLIFEGTEKIKVPQKKYFPVEDERLMAPGSKYHIIERYTIRGIIPPLSQTQQQTVRVFRLSNVQENQPRQRLGINDITQG